MSAELIADPDILLSNATEVSKLHDLRSGQKGNTHKKDPLEGLLTTNASFNVSWVISGNFLR